MKEIKRLKVMEFLIRNSPGEFYAGDIKKATGLDQVNYGHFNMIIQLLHRSGVVSINKQKKGALRIISVSPNQKRVMAKYMKDKYSDYFQNNLN